MPTGREHRRHRRYQISIPVAIHSPEEVEEAAVQTSTRDISAKGIFFTLSPGVELGSELEFYLSLPPQMCQGKSVRVHCRGRVVRREPLAAQDRIGVAAVIDEYEFIQQD
ncbi:MAG: type pilus assembly PilZ [Acidobacteria bacterium]|nr:type pilus assembly PilZ [Acidobacteriota bacterium]